MVRGTGYAYSCTPQTEHLNSERLPVLPLTVEAMFFPYESFSPFPKDSDQYDHIHIWHDSYLLNVGTEKESTEVV